MALIQTTYLYEILARCTPEGLQGCQKVIGTIISDDSTEPPTVISNTLAGAVAITPAEAAELITTTPLIPEPEPEPESEPEPEAE